MSLSLDACFVLATDFLDCSPCKKPGQSEVQLELAECTDTAISFK